MRFCGIIVITVIAIVIISHIFEIIVILVMNR